MPSSSTRQTETEQDLRRQCFRAVTVLKTIGKAREGHLINWVAYIYASVLDQTAMELLDWAQVPPLLPDWSNVRVVDQHHRWYLEIEKEIKGLLAHEKVAKVADILSDAATLLAHGGRDAEASKAGSCAEAAANAAHLAAEDEERIC